MITFFFFLISQNHTNKMKMYK